ncbi:MAG TPA: condensation domain-containing protein, partial [Allosphingosinicella sp.]
MTSGDFGSTGDMVEGLERRGIHLALEGDNIRVRGSVGSLSALDREHLTARKAELRAHLAERHRQRGIPIADRSGPLPLSFTQERLWFLDQLGGASAVYNDVAAATIAGPLDVAALGDAFTDLVARHEALRTRFAVAGEGAVQRIDAPWTLALAAEDVEPTRVEARVFEFVRRPFDLQNDRLLRVAVFRVAPERHVLAVVLHHIVTDGWSMGVMMREVGLLYAAHLFGAPSPLAPLPVQYADWAVWQRSQLQGEKLERQLGWWREKLAGAPAALDLPTDRTRPAVQSFAGDIHRFTVPAELAGQLQALARREGATLFMVLLAAYQLILSRWSGQEQVVVGTPIANRTRAETEGLIGFFANTLALPADLAGAPTFRELLAQVRETALGAYAHQDLPFEK